MKMLRFALSAAALSLAAPAFAGPAVPPHMELDMTSAEYRALTKHFDELESDDPLTAILQFGKRNLDWLEHINAARTEGNKLELSTAATQTGYPIDQATFSNREIIAAAWNAQKETMPAFIKEIVLEGGDFIRDLPVSDEDFLVQIRAIDKLYQRASRWLLQEPYLEYYAQAAAEDVRGYYYLQREPDLQAKLTGWFQLDQATRTRLETLLVGQCRNSDLSAETCKAELASTLSRSRSALGFHQRYVTVAAQHWNDYFRIQGTRSDVTWTGEDQSLASIPFLNPRRDDVLAWLRDNIEDEWKWEGWQLKLDFQDEGDENMTHIKFEAGATPHVNGIAGSEITMDGNRSIGEYSSRWTIRHEYGHVLGFPDCYLEFYDVSTQQMVQYQLDITNLMCSRRGKLQQSHFDEMKRIYYRP